MGVGSGCGACARRHGMFRIDMSDPRALWLTITNIALGLAVLGGLAALLYAIGREWLERVEERHGRSRGEVHPFRRKTGVRFR